MNAIINVQGLHYSARESDDEVVGYCRFCARHLYIPGSRFCNRGCENRKRQLGWKLAPLDLPKLRRNRYVWDNQTRKPEDFTNFSNYKASWEMVGQ